jgi:hypothetical protein
MNAEGEGEGERAGNQMTTTGHKRPHTESMLKDESINGVVVITESVSTE